VADGIQQSGKRPNIKGISMFVAAKAVNYNPVFGSVMDVAPDSKWSVTKPKPSSKSSDPSFTRITMVNPQGTASGKQGNQSRCGSGSE